MWWFLLFVVVVLVIVFSKAGECYECGSRDPSVFSSAKTRALCDKCLVAGECDKDL